MTSKMVYVILGAPVTALSALGSLTLWGAYNDLSQNKVHRGLWSNIAKDFLYRDWEKADQHIDEMEKHFTCPCQMEKNTVEK